MGLVLVRGRERVGKVYCHDIYCACEGGGGVNKCVMVGERVHSHCHDCRRGYGQCTVERVRRVHCHDCRRG